MLDGRQSQCKACGNIRAKAWRAKYPERDKANHDAWAADNVGTMRASRRGWYARNPSKVLATTRKYQATKKAATCECCQGEDAKANFELVYAIGRKLGMHVDHVKPLAKGGLHCLKNLQYLTPTQNKRKGAKWQEAA